MKIPVLALFAVLALPLAALAEIKTREVAYTGGGVTMKGFLAWDSTATGKRGGVLVVHEWWGQNDYARMRAKKLAELGYVALAVDMYGDGKTASHPDDAGKFAKEATANMESARARFEAARKILLAEKNVDPKKIAAIGYCFGGGVVLEMARRGADLAAVASFHGSLATEKPAEKGKVRAKILVATGSEDPFVPTEQVDALESEMKAAGADCRVVRYAGAKHSFTNPGADETGKKFGLPLAYDEKADKESWEEMKKLLARAFGG